MVRASTNTGRPADLYRLLLPPHGGSGGASSGGGEERRKAVSLETAVQDTLISPLVDAYLVTRVGDHPVDDNMHGVDIPTFSHQLLCRIHGQRSQVRVSDEEYQSYIDIYLLIY